MPKTFYYAFLLCGNEGKSAGLDRSDLLAAIVAYSVKGSGVNVSALFVATGGKDKECAEHEHKSNYLFHSCSFYLIQIYYSNIISYSYTIFNILRK